MPRPVSRALTAEQYREVFGWTIQRRDSRSYLALGRGMVAVSVPAALGPEVAFELKRRDSDGPVIATTGRDPRWLFLADPNEAVFTRDDLPTAVALLECPTVVPVPIESTPSDRPRWAERPNLTRRWLPTAASVLCAISCCLHRLEP